MTNFLELKNERNLLISQKMSYTIKIFAFEFLKMVTADYWTAIISMTVGIDKSAFFNPMAAWTHSTYKLTTEHRFKYYF